MTMVYVQHVSLFVFLFEADLNVAFPFVFAKGLELETWKVQRKKNLCKYYRIVSYRVICCCLLLRMKVVRCMFFRQIRPNVPQTLRSSATKQIFPIGLNRRRTESEAVRK